MNTGYSLTASVCAAAGYAAVLNASMTHTQVTYAESGLRLRVPTSSESASTLSAVRALKYRGVLDHERYNVLKVVIDAIFDVVHRAGGARTLSQNMQASYTALLGILNSIEACAYAVNAEAGDDDTVQEDVVSAVDIVCAGGVLTAWSVCAGAGTSSQAAICLDALSGLPAPLEVPRVDRERYDTLVAKIVEIETKGDMDRTLVGLVEEFMESGAPSAVERLAERATTLAALRKKGYPFASISDGPVSAGITLDSTARDTRGIITRIMTRRSLGGVTHTFALFRGDHESSIVLFEFGGNTESSDPMATVSLVCVVVKDRAASNAAFVKGERDATASHLEATTRTTDIKDDVMCIFKIHRAFASQSVSAGKDVFICGVITNMLVNAESVAAARALDGDDVVILPWSRDPTDVKRNLALDCGVVAVAAACVFCQNLSDSADWTMRALRETAGDSSHIDKELVFLAELAVYEKTKFRDLEPVASLLTPGVLAGTDLMPMGRPHSRHALSIASAIATVRVLSRLVA